MFTAERKNSSIGRNNRVGHRPAVADRHQGGAQRDRWLAYRRALIPGRSQQIQRR
jgi:hypothetical protein